MARPSRSEYTARTRDMTDTLRADIRSGKLRPGDYLPSEKELGQAFGLSKESVRKALDTLVQEKLIVKIRRVGNRVIGSNGEDEEEGDGGGLEGATHFPDRSPDRTGAVSEEERRTGMGDGGLTVRLAYYPSLETEAMLLEAVKSFEDAHPGTTVQKIPTPFPLEFAEHGMADVVTLTAWDALKLKERDAAFSRMADAPDTDFAHALLAEPFRSADGRLAAAPFVFSPVVLCYNREHFASCSLEEPGEGWTWYTLLKTAKSLTRQLGISGFAAHIQSVNRWPVFLLQNGFRFGGEHGRAAENPALWESLRIARDLIHGQGGEARLWTESDADVERWFKEYRVSMVMTTYFGLNRLRDAKLDYGVATLPALRSDATLLLVTGLAVCRDARQPYTAQALVRHLCGDGIQAAVRRHTLTLPAHLQALNVSDGLDGNRPGKDISREDLWGKCRLYSDLRLGTEVLEAIREELKAYWSRLEDEAEASERLELVLGP